MVFVLPWFMYSLCEYLTFVSISFKGFDCFFVII